MTKKIQMTVLAMLHRTKLEDKFLTEQKENTNSRNN